MRIASDQHSFRREQLAASQQKQLLTTFQFLASLAQENSLLQKTLSLPHFAGLRSEDGILAPN
jgi:hypothetical protein